MIIKNSNQAIDVQKNSHVSWEGQKSSKRFYVKKTETLIKTEYGSDPNTVPNISWEGGTTQTFNLYRKETYLIREGFSTRTEERVYNYPNASFKSGETSGCKINNTPTQYGQNTYNNPFSVTFEQRDNASSDRTIIIYAVGLRGDIHEQANITITQTKRDKYVTKLDNAVITVDNIPASGGTVSSGKLTYRKTFNSGETEDASETVTFTTVSATTKGTTESGVTNVKTIAAGGTIQKSTTIDSVTLTHPEFTVKQDANVKSVKTGETKTTESVILSVSPTVVYSSGGTVTFSLSRKYTLHKTVYQYSSGSTSGGGTDANQGPETLSANSNYTVSGISGTTNIRGGSYTIPATSSARTIKFQTTYDNIKSNEATVTQKLDGPDTSKAFYYTDLNITTFSYAKGSSGYHFPASGGTITATDCTLKGTYIWHYTSMEGKTSQETVNWTLSDLTNSMYTFTPTSKTAESLGTTTASANNSYATISVAVKGLKHIYDGKQYDVKNNSGTILTATSTATLTRQGNSGTQASIESSSKLKVSVDPTTYDYKGGSATLKAVLTKTYNVSWTSGATSTKDTDTTVTNVTTFTGSYKIGSSTTDNSITVSDSSVTIPNLGTSKDSRKYTFTGSYNGLTGTATLSQTGNTTTYTVTFSINNSYAKWYRNGSAITDTTVTKKFSEGTKYTDLTPDETPTWIDGSNYKYTFANNYSTKTDGNAVSSSSTLQSDITLYARWTQPTAYIKVTWDPNGGTLSASSGSGTKTTEIYYYYAKGSVTVSTTDAGYKVSPTKSKYSFVAWVDADGGHSMPYTFNLTSSHKFTANFTITEKNIYWNSNGGVFSDNTTQKSTTVNYGDKTKTYNSEPTKAADKASTYSFSGWSLTSTGSIVTFPYPITTINNTFNFYAIYSSSARSYTIYWKSYPVYNFYSKDDQTYTSSTTTTEKYDTVYKDIKLPSGVKVTLYNSDKSEQYKSNGSWYTTETGNIVIKDNDTTVTGDTTFYLHFSTNYKVILDCNGGQVSSSDKSTKWEIYVTSFKYDDYKPVKTDYTFAGWNIRDTDTSGTLTGSQKVSEAKTYYATWSKDSVTITWRNHTNGAVVIWADGTAEDKKSSVKKGTKYNELSAPASFADIIEDATFIRYTAAWYTKPYGGTLISKTETAITTATSVYTQFTYVSAKVSLYPNGGSLVVSDTTYTTSPYVIYVKSINLGSYTPTRSGYNFKGWAETSSATSGSTSTVTIKTATPYYAAWKQVFTVTWNLNGGTYNSSTTNPTQSVESGSTVSFSTYTPTKSGYTFQGWAESNSATSGSTSGNSAAITSNKTFYAIWKSAALTPILLILAS